MDLETADRGGDPEIPDSAAKESESVTEDVMIKINRSYYTQSDFNIDCNRLKRKQTAQEKLAQTARKCFTPSCDRFRKTALSFFPFIGIMKKYSLRNDLLNDVASGLTVGVMHIPQGMAYGMLANVDPVYGLYTSFFPVIVYFFLGTSLHISLGTFAVVSLMVGGVVERSDCFGLFSNDKNISDAFANETLVELKFNGSYNNTTGTDVEDTQANDMLMCKVGYVMAVSMVVGIYQFCMGLFRIGFVTIYLSDPLTRALTTGAAVHVFTSQIRHVFGISTARFSGPLKLVYFYIEFLKHISNTNVASLVMAIVCIIVLYSLQRWVAPVVKARFKLPLPLELLMLIVCTLISALAKFSSKDVFRIKVVGHIPTGFPMPSFPPPSIFPSVAVDAIGIAMVSFTINISMAKMFAKKHSYSLDSNQELMAYGITNFVCSMLNCYVSTASLSRSIIQESVGGKTQVAGLVSCSLLLVVLLAVGPLFRELPNCVLAAIIIVNLKGVFLQITDLPGLLKISALDMMVWIVTFVSVVLTDVDLGLLIGVAFSLLSVVFKTQKSHTAILGRIPHTDIYEDTKEYQAAKEIPKMKIFRFTASLCSFNAEHFVKKLHRKTGCNPATLKSARKEFVKRSESSRKTEEDSQVRCRCLRKRETAMRSDAPESMPMSNADGGDQTIRSDAVEEDNVVTSLMPTADVTTIVIDCSCMAFVDAVGISTLEQVIQDYRDIQVRIMLARCNDQVYELLRKTICKKADKKAEKTKDKDKQEEEERLKSKIFVTVHDAVMAAVYDRRDVDAEMTAELGSVTFLGNPRPRTNGDAVGNLHSEMLEVTI